MTQTNIFAQKLLGPSIFTPKALIPYVGARAAALLQQLHYSQQTSSTFTECGERWVSRTLEDWGTILTCHKRTIKRAFDRLESMGLVVSDHFHKHLYDRCKSYRVDYEALTVLLSEETKCLDRPRQSVPIDGDKVSFSNNKILNTDLKEQQTEKVEITRDPELESNPTHHPVSKIDKEGIVVDPEILCKGDAENSLESSQVPETIPKIEKSEIEKPEELKTRQKPEKPKKTNQEKLAELDPELEQEIVETVGHKISFGLKMMVIQASSEVVKDALTVLRTAKNVKNKAGLLRRAIEEKWKPSAAAAEPEKKQKYVLEPDFNEWWGYAKQLGLVMGSEIKGEDFWIYAAPSGEPTLYEEMRSMFSMNWLKKRIHREC